METKLRTYSKLHELLNNRRFIIATVFFISLLFFQIDVDIDKDVYRYKWDGFIFKTYLNPYINTPNQLKEHANEFPYWNRMQFKDFYAVYPPGSQLVFLIDHYLFGFSMNGLKLIFLGFLLVSVHLFILLLEHLKRPRVLIWLFVLNPLLYFETVGTVHNEILMITFLLASILMVYKKKNFVAALYYSFSVCSKIIPIFIFPLLLVFIYKKGKLKDALLFTIIFALITFLIYAPFVYLSGSNVFSSLTILAENWIFAPGAFYILMIFFGMKVSKTIYMLIITSIILVASSMLYKNKSREHMQIFINSIYFILLMVLILNSAVFPWYVLWVLWLVPLIKDWLPITVLSITGLLVIPIGENVEGLNIVKQLTLWVPFYFSLFYIIIQRNFSRFTLKKS